MVTLIRLAACYGCIADTQAVILNKRRYKVDGPSQGWQKPSPVVFFGFFWVLLGFIGFYWVFLGFLFFINSIAYTLPNNAFFFWFQ